MKIPMFQPARFNKVQEIEILRDSPRGYIEVLREFVVRQESLSGLAMAVIISYRVSRIGERVWRVYYA